jgi:hypothetical protein
MKPLELEGVSAALSDAADTPRQVSATKEVVPGRARGIGQICRQLFGARGGAPPGCAGSVTARFLRAGDRAQVREKRATLLLGTHSNRTTICGSTSSRAGVGVRAP